MHLLLKIHSGIANSVDPDQTASSSRVLKVKKYKVLSNFFLSFFRESKAWQMSKADFSEK